MNYAKWFRDTLKEAALQSKRREHLEADFRRCLRHEKGRNVAARVDRMFCLMGCWVKDAEGN